MIGDVAYLRFNEFPEDPAVASAARGFLVAHADAKAVIIDARPHRGGGLGVMDAILPLLYARETHLVRMDTRASVADSGPMRDGPTLVRQPSAPTIVSRDHVVTPDTAERRLQHVPVYYLTSRRTASAAEHLALAFKRTHRATLIGETTRGAGHYGGLQPIGDRFAAFIPVGRTYDPDTGWDWEGKGVAPDVAVPADQALDEALKEARSAGVRPDAAHGLTRPALPVRAEPDSDIVVAAPTLAAPGVWLISGALRPKREPDGNTVVFEAPGGLIVVDTGRHLAHRQAIEAFAKSRRADIIAIVNSHWHLDHVSGNPYLKSAYPGANVYASRAIDGALAGFLAEGAAENRKALESDDLPPQTKEDIRGDLATVANGAALRPDVAIDASRAVRLGGRKLALNLARDAATAGDVWVYDPETGVAAVGDLVTLPSPFLDTACPLGWKTALAKIWETPFRIAVPGHGAPMTRVQFATWRASFAGLIECSASNRDKTECAAGWVTATAGLRESTPRERKLAQEMTEYYVADVLRRNGGKSTSCKGV